MALFDVINDCVELCVNGAIHQIVMINADDRAIGRNDLYGHVVDLTKLRVLCHCRTRHTGELLIHQEVVLERNGCKSLIFFSNLNTFFCLNCLVKTLRVPSTFHNTAGKLIYNLNFTVHDNILLITMKHKLGFQRLLKMIDELSCIVTINFHAKRALNFCKTCIRCGNGMLCLIHLKINLRNKPTNGSGKIPIGTCRLSARSRDNKRSTSLIDKD